MQEPIHVEIFGQPTAVFLLQRGPPFKRAQLEALQERIGPFPPDYLYFLKKYNGGITDFSTLYIPGQVSTNGIEHFFSVQEIDALTSWDNPLLHTANAIPIGEDGSSNFLYMHIRGPAAGCICFYDADAYYSTGSFWGGSMSLLYFMAIAKSASRIRVEGDGKVKPKGAVTSNSGRRIDGEDAELQGVDTLDVKDTSMEDYGPEDWPRGNVMEALDVWMNQARTLAGFHPDYAIQLKQQALLARAHNLAVQAEAQEEQPQQAQQQAQQQGQPPGPGQGEGNTQYFLAEQQGKSNLFAFDFSPVVFKDPTGQPIYVDLDMGGSIEEGWGYFRGGDISTADVLAQRKYNVQIDPVFRHNNGLFWEYGPGFSWVGAGNNRRPHTTMMLVPKKMASIGWGGVPHVTSVYKLMKGYIEATNAAEQQDQARSSSCCVIL